MGGWFAGRLVVDGGEIGQMGSARGQGQGRWDTVDLDAQIFMGIYSKTATALHGSPLPIKYRYCSLTYYIVHLSFTLKYRYCSLTDYVMHLSFTLLIKA